MFLDAQKFPGVDKSTWQYSIKEDREERLWSKENMGGCLASFYLQGVIFNKGLTSSPIVLCVFSTARSNCYVGYPWRAFPMFLLDVTWVSFLVSQPPHCLPKWCFWKYTSFSAAHGHSLWSYLFQSKTSFLLESCYSQECLRHVSADSFLFWTPEDWM